MKKFLGTLVLGAALLINSSVAAETKESQQKQEELITGDKKLSIINRVDNKNTKKCVPKKSKIKHSRIFCISEKDILELGVYKPIKNFPEGMINEFGKACRNEICIFKKAGKKMYRIFVQRTAIYHARYPGEMIKGMAWYELFYHGKLKKVQKEIEKFNNYSLEKKRKSNRITSQINSLVKMNKGRENMRKAMGMSLDDDIETVIKKHWVLGEFLNNDKLKVKKIKIDPEIKKRKLLLEKYQTTLKKYKLKLEEEKNKKKKL